MNNGSHGYFLRPWHKQLLFFGKVAVCFVTRRKTTSEWKQTDTKINIWCVHNLYIIYNVHLAVGSTGTRRQMHTHCWFFRVQGQTAALLPRRATWRDRDAR